MALCTDKGKQDQATAGGAPIRLGAAGEGAVDSPTLCDGILRMASKHVCLQHYLNDLLYL